MKQFVRNERGMALAIAIFALVIVGALVAGAMFAGTQEQRIGETTRRLEQSFGVSELGIYNVVNNWNPTTFNQRGVYPTDSVAINGTAPRGTGSYGGYVYRLNNELYLIDVTGHDTVSGRAGYGGGRARQRIGLLTRTRVLQMDIQASLTTQNSTRMAGNSQVNGFDQIPPIWSGCDPAGAPKAGVRADLGDTVSTQGASTILGMPAVKIDSTVKDSTFTQFGDVSYTQLTSRANVVVPPGTYPHIAPVVTNGACDRTVNTNWGDGVTPANACGGYFPIIYVPGDISVNGDQGQGILLVDGNLDVQGGFQFFGIVIVRGTLTTAGGGATDAHFWGAVMSQNVNLADDKITGRANLNFSRCAILRALDNTAVVTAMRSRSWIQLF